jgi:D-lyxose ketol-isomerase
LTASPGKTTCAALAEFITQKASAVLFTLQKKVYAADKLDLQQGINIYLITFVWHVYFADGVGDVLVPVLVSAMSTTKGDASNRAIYRRGIPSAGVSGDCFKAI